MTDHKQLAGQPNGQSGAGAAEQAETLPRQGAESGRYASLISGIGYVLAASYPVLALSTGTRALYQLLLKEGVADSLPALLSLLAAVIYMVAAFGFAYRRPWTWRLSLAALGIEAALVLIIGTWSVIDPSAVGRTVWRHYGEDYGYFPLIQPMIGLLWLLWPATRTLYHRPEVAAKAPAAFHGA